MFDEAYDNLYVGEFAALQRQTAVRDEGISAVVRLDQFARESLQWADEFTLLDMPIPDGEYLDGDKIDTVTAFIHEQIEGGASVLVHCLAGVSRSVTLAMAYLIAYKSMSLAEAFGVVREGRPAAYPHELLLVSLIDHYKLPYDTSTVYNPQFIARLIADA
jgi:protein-tyrosine phosphatase